MKKFIIIILLALSPGAGADYTVTWEPAPDGGPVENWLLWCIPADLTFGAPNVLPESDRSYVHEWPGPAGQWKCKMAARNSSGDSGDSETIFFTLADSNGDGNNVVIGDDPPVIDPPAIPVTPRIMTITRKGYFTITGPDDALLTKPDGSTRQVTSKDEAFEYTSKDGRLGIFTVNPPSIEVDWSL